MKKAPWARFSTRHTPKMSESPAASRKRIDADTSPLTTWSPISTRRAVLLLRPDLLDLFLAGQEPLAPLVAHVLHGGPLERLVPHELTDPPAPGGALGG